MAIGGVTLNAAATNVHLDQYVYVDAGTDLLHAKASIGTVSIGNIALTAKGGTAHAYNYQSYDASGAGATIGAVTVGNVSMVLSQYDAAKATVSDTFDLYVDAGKSGGSITAGNISVSTSGLTAKAAATSHMYGHVTMTSTQGTVTVGNIAVSGAGINDNLGTLLGTWLILNGTGTETIGNVDYSAYKGVSTLDVSTVKGALNIAGSTGGSTVTDNKTQNNIVLNDATHDTVTLQTAQLGVNASGSTAATVFADPTKIDTITGFSTGEKIFSLGGALTTINDNTAGLASYAAFLADAVANVGTGALWTVDAATVGNNTYVAFVNTAGTGIGEIVELVGVHGLAQVLTISGGGITHA